MNTRLKDTALKDCPENDALLMDLIKALEKCSKDNGNCDTCLKLKDCRGLWDELAEMKHHNKLKRIEFVAYREMIKTITDQGVMFQ